MPGLKNGLSNERILGFYCNFYGKKQFTLPAPDADSHAIERQAILVRILLMEALWI